MEFPGREASILIERQRAFKRGASVRANFRAKCFRSAVEFLYRFGNWQWLQGGMRCPQRVDERPRKHLTNPACYPPVSAAEWAAVLEWDAAEGLLEG